MFIISMLSISFITFVTFTLLKPISNFPIPTCISMRCYSWLIDIQFDTLTDDLHCCPFCWVWWCQSHSVGIRCYSIRLYWLIILHSMTFIRRGIPIVTPLSHLIFFDIPLFEIFIVEGIQFILIVDDDWFIVVGIYSVLCRYYLFLLILHPVPFCCCQSIDLLMLIFQFREWFHSTFGIYLFPILSLLFVHSNSLLLMTIDLEEACWPGNLIYLLYSFHSIHLMTILFCRRCWWPPFPDLRWLTRLSLVMISVIDIRYDEDILMTCVSFD